MRLGVLAFGASVTNMQFEIEFNAIERERKRVAKELHDDILPSLARLTRLLQANGVSGELVKALHATLAAFRDLLGELHPVDLEELGLVAALDNICARYARLTGRCVLFVDKVEEFDLSHLQELCLYRAMQAVLRMFCDSENDILLVTSSCESGVSMITVRCIDKRVSSAEWLSVDKDEFNAFESWCAMAGAKVELRASQYGEFPCDLIITVPQQESAMAASDLILRETVQTELDCASDLFETLAVESERKKINKDVERLIMPQFNWLTHLAERLECDLPELQLSQRLYAITAGVRAIMSELHPPLLTASGLIPSIKTLVDRFRLDSHIETTLVSSLQSAQVNISLEAKFAIYRVTQEALNNIEKHSAASVSRITVKQVACGLVICIEDNGRGFQEKRSTQCRGLKNIRERAAAIGAEVVWERSTSFPTGTLVSISLKNTSGPACQKEALASTNSVSCLS